jgi:hypothetical protein
MQRFDRYPNMVCPACESRACDAEGRRVEFFNEGEWGGCVGSYVGTKENYDSRFCYIDGVKCRVDEGHTGGIVYEIVKDAKKGE